MLNYNMGGSQNCSKDRRKTASIGLILIFTLAMFIGSCSHKAQTFLDGIGRTIELKHTPERLVSLSPAHTEILFALGLGDKVVGVSNWCNKPQGALEKEKVGDAFNLNKEILVSLNPDIVFIPGDEDSQMVKEIEELDIVTYVSNPETVDDVFDDITKVAEVTGTNLKGEQLVVQLKQELKQLAQVIETHVAVKPEVLVVIDQELWTVGPGSFINEVLALAGGNNIIKDKNMAYLQISMEDVLIKNPDVILITIPEELVEDLVSRPGWGELSAVKEEKVYFVDDDLISRPGPSIIDGVKHIARHLYPDLEE